MSGLKQLVWLTWFPYNAGAQIRADAAEQKLKDAEAQLRASGQQEAELSAGMMGSASRQGPEADAQQERAKIGKQMQAAAAEPPGSIRPIQGGQQQPAAVCRWLIISFHIQCGKKPTHHLLWIKYQCSCGIVSESFECEWPSLCRLLDSRGKSTLHMVTSMEECHQEEAVDHAERIAWLEGDLQREASAAPQQLPRLSQEQLRDVNMQLHLQLERLQQRLAAEAEARLAQRQPSHAPTLSALSSVLLC